MVPNGWEAVEVDDLAKFSSGGTPSKQNEAYWNGSEPWISGKDLKTHYLYSSIDKLTDEGFAAAKKAPKGSTLILVRGMTLLKDFPVGYATRELSFNQDVKALVPSKNVDGLYLSFLLSGDKHKIMNLVSTAGHGTGRLDTNLLKQHPVNLPPLSEQQKIAKILSTWDKAISTTERLIDNSTQQKQAVMQQLLTGKKRLLSTNSSFSVRDGFAKSKLGELPDDWNLSLIPKFYWFQEGPGVRKHQFTETGVKLLNGTNIQKSRVDLTTTKTHISEDEAYGGYKHFLADSGDLIIACSGISVDRFDEKIAFLEDHHLPLCMNTSTMRFKVKKDAKASLEFLRYFMMSPLFKNQIRRQITGSAQLNFGPSHVDKCYIALPSYDEQQKIAAVLINADKQIDLLEQQLADLQQEKKALMQVLLTGKKRVRVDGEG